MKLFDNKECIVISWDKDKNVFGIKTRRGKGRKLTVLDYVMSETVEMKDTSYSDTSETVSGDSLSGFQENLSDVYNALNPKENQLIILGGDISESVCFEINVPPMSPDDIKEAISYEIPRYIPVEAEDIYIGYRVIPKVHKTSGNAIDLRVFAVKKDKWDTLLEVVSNAGVKGDFILHPFTVVDPLLHEHDVCLKGVCSEYAFHLDSEDGFRRSVYIAGEASLKDKLDLVTNRLKEYVQEVQRNGETEPIDSLPEEFTTALLLAVYGSSLEIQKDQMTLLGLPHKMIPERFRGLRILFLIMIIIVGLIILFFMARIWKEDRDRLAKIKDENEKVVKQVRALKKENMESQKLEEFIDKIYDVDAGNHEIIYCLLKLTERIPRDIWLTNFSSRGNVINLTLLTTSEKVDSNLPSLQKIKVWKITDKHERVVRGGKNIYVRLEYIPPKKKREVKKDV